LMRRVNRLYLPWRLPLFLDDKYYDDDKHKGDDIYHPSDDYLDDDRNDDGLTSNESFWKTLDAVFGYFEKLYCLVADCAPEEIDPYPDDSKDEDKKKYTRALSTSNQSWWSIIVGSGSSANDALVVPSSMEEWLQLSGDGTCPFTDCNGVDSPSQCFEGQHVVGKTCRDTLNDWFKVPAPEEDHVMSWQLDMACYNQDYCYASNVFGQTACDEQFYKSLLQACPSTGSQSLTLSRNAPLATTDLYEQCSLVSILLYSKVHHQDYDAYELTQDMQSMFESNDCRHL